MSSNMKQRWHTIVEIWQDKFPRHRFCYLTDKLVGFKTSKRGYVWFSHDIKNGYQERGSTLTIPANLRGTVTKHDLPGLA